MHLATLPGAEPDAAVFGIPDGTITRVDPSTGATAVWASGLVMPNGLAFLPDGSAVTTRVVLGLGIPSAVTRVGPEGDPVPRLDELLAS